MSRREVTTIAAAVVVAVTTTVSAMAWINGNVDEKVDRSEFESYVRMSIHQHQQVLRRLQSIEEAIRERR